MTGADHPHPRPDLPGVPGTAPHPLLRTAIQVLFGTVGVAFITFIASLYFPIHTERTRGIGPGTISLLYLIVVAVVSFWGNLASSAAVSVIAAFCLNYFILPLVPALEAKNPLDIVATVIFLGTAAVITGIVTRLRERTALLDTLFEQAPQSLALLVDLRVILVNRKFTRVFGYTQYEAEGRLLRELIVPAEFLDEFQRNAELVYQGQHVVEETVRQCKDGSRLHVSAFSVRIALPHRQIAVYAMYSDITARKAAEAELRALSVRLMEVQETERRHLARELHDEISQLLTGLRLLLTPPDAIASRTEQCLAILDDLLARVRNLSFNLRPADLDEFGLVPALLTLFERYTAQTGVSVNFKHPGMEGRFAREVETAGYRVVQEALTNVARHAGVPRVAVLVWTDGGKLNLQIEDQGAGFDPEAVLSAPQSSGLIGMLERIRLLGGSVAVDSNPGAGTTITAELPLNRKSPSPADQ